jgi:hypothetical protein
MKWIGRNWTKVFYGGLMMTLTMGFWGCDRIEGAFERTWAKEEGTWDRLNSVSAEDRAEIERKIAALKEWGRQGFRNAEKYEGLLYTPEEIDAQWNGRIRDFMREHNEDMLHPERLVNPRQMLKHLISAEQDQLFPKNPHYGFSKYDYSMSAYSSDKELRENRERNQSADREVLTYIGAVVIIMIICIIIVIQLIMKNNKARTKKRIKEQADRLERLKRAY